MNVLGLDPDLRTNVLVAGICPTDEQHVAEVSRLHRAWICQRCDGAGNLDASRWRQALRDVGPFAKPVEGLPGRTAEQLLKEAPESVNWLVPGFLVPGWATKVAAREKAGKGTFNFYVLGCLERGEPTVFGDAFGRPVTAVVYTEEPMESVQEKIEAFGLSRSRIIYGYELADLDSWKAKAKRLVQIAVEEGHEVLFVDNISKATGVEDENGVELGRAVEALITPCREWGIACIVDHHHKKGGGSDEDKSRGGTALPGATDINVDIFRSGKDNPRKRRLSSRGRLRSTNWDRHVELADDGRSYSAADAPVGEDGETMSPADQAAVHWTMALRGLGGEATVDELERAGRASDSTVRRYMKRLQATGEVAKGYRDDGKVVFRLVDQIPDQGLTSVTSRSSLDR